MIKVFVAVLVITTLNGCAFYETKHFRAWALCYRSDTLLPNGMYESSELQRDGCNKRRQIQFQYKPGVIPDNDVLKGIKDFRDRD